MQTNSMMPQQQIMNPTNFVDKAIQRREARLEESTAKEIQNLDKMEKTGVMSPVEAEALKMLALGSLKVDKKSMPVFLPKGYPQPQPTYRSGNI